MTVIRKNKRVKTMKIQTLYLLLRMTLMSLTSIGRQNLLRFTHCNTSASQQLI